MLNDIEACLNGVVVSDALPYRKIFDAAEGSLCLEMLT